MEDATRAELARLLVELESMRLPPEAWSAIEVELRAVRTGEDSAVDRLSQTTFEARVQHRFQGGRASSTLPPTKQTSALPWVGLVCGGLLLAVGGALGGGAVFVGVALLGLFVFGIAMAGSRVAHRRPNATVLTPDRPAVAMPDEVKELIRSLRSSGT